MHVEVDIDEAPMIGMTLQLPEPLGDWRQRLEATIYWLDWIILLVVGMVLLLELLT